MIPRRRAGASSGVGADKVLVAMSGGVDSSVAAALLLDAGRDVTGVTMKLWGGESDTGCCSVADVDDARRVADQLGIEHHVFNFGDEFEASVVAPYVVDHGAGCTPNPCVECNRHLKFDKLLRRATALGFATVATGHHARVVGRPDGSRRVARGADRAKDQSYVVAMLDQDRLGRVLFPVGDLDKDGVRATARRLGLRTASKPDSQDVCFVTAARGRAEFLSRRLALSPGRVLDRDGVAVGHVEAIELVTVGQRRGLGMAGGAAPRYVVDVDTARATVTVGSRRDLARDAVGLRDLRWSHEPVGGPLLAQCSAHGEARPATLDLQVRAERGEPTTGLLRWARPQRRVAPGQSVVLYDSEDVVGSAVAT